MADVPSGRLRLTVTEIEKTFRTVFVRKAFSWGILLTINEQISNAFVRLHKPFRQKSTILMVDFCHLP